MAKTTPPPQCIVLLYNNIIRKENGELCKYEVSANILSNYINFILYMHSCSWKLTMNQRVMVVVVIMTCLSYCVLFYMSSIWKMNKPNLYTMLPIVNGKFLYLVQTGSCLPDHLMSLETFGNSTVCECDILVLSYKELCGDNATEHVEYIFDSSATTWNRGRNRLFEAMRLRRKKYLYYIFMDDDIILRSKASRMNPWRAFENFLEEIEPAIGIAEVDGYGNLDFVYNGRKERNCTLEGTPDYLPIAHFDSAFNAFHYKAVESILPYPTKFDNISWWFSGWYATIKSEVIFAGQTLALTKVMVLNSRHRAYPRKYPDAKDWIAIMEVIEASLPQEYRNVSLFLDWKKGHEHEQTSPALCLPPPPPHMPIKPFGYLEQVDSILTIAS